MKLLIWPWLCLAVWRLGVYNVRFILMFGMALRIFFWIFIRQCFVSFDEWKKSVTLFFSFLLELTLLNLNSCYLKVTLRHHHQSQFCVNFVLRVMVSINETSLTSDTLKIIIYLSSTNTASILYPLIKFPPKCS